MLQSVMDSHEYSPPTKAPGVVECYICHREFGSMSIGIHEPKCLSKWRRENDKLPNQKKKDIPQRDSNIGSGERTRRPRTAILDCPRVLDPAYIHVDMSSLTCDQLPKNVSIRAECDEERRTVNLKRKGRKKWVKDQGKLSPIRFSPASDTELTRRKEGKGKVQLSSTSLTSITRFKRVEEPVIDDIFRGPNYTAEEVSPPCTTCQRSSQPERFHSHPPNHTPLVNGIRRVKATHHFDIGDKPLLPLDDSSSSNDDEAPPEPSVRKSNLPVKVLRRRWRRGSDATEKVLAYESENYYVIVDESVIGRPEAVVCYACGKEFGANSLSIHEPNCIKRFNHEQNILEEELREPLPPKPPCPITLQDWNVFAWVTQQIPMSPCQHCYRSFPENRIPIHQRLCLQKSLGTSPTDTTEHKPDSHREIVVPCYICGVEIGVTRIKSHEEDCLDRWRKNNNKLPPRLRKKTEPTKHVDPDAIPFQWTEDGWIDFRGTARAIWQAHLNDLVQCKMCGRSFFPDRIEKHEATCAAEKINK